VLAVQTFRTVDEVIEKANNTSYGLSAGVWTDKGSKIFHVGSQLRAGVVWANTYNKFDPSSPFGGYKESGFGREGGLHGLGAYVRFLRTRPFCSPISSPHKLFSFGPGMILTIASKIRIFYKGWRQSMGMLFVKGNQTSPCESMTQIQKRRSNVYDYSH
jgi:hypothetical protein